MTDITELNEIESQEEINANTQDTQETLNSEPVIAEEYNIVEFNDISGKLKSIDDDGINERIPEPWENAPEGLIYYEKMYDDGHLGSFTKSAELAYKFGWFENSISESDLKVSDINGWTYRKDLCPMKTQEMIDRENAIQEINQLKKQLSDTDYKAIKFAEGEINPEEYLPIKNQRAEWRAKINQLQAEFDI